MKSNRKETKQKTTTPARAKTRESKAVPANKPLPWPSPLSVSFIYCILRAGKRVRESLDQALAPLGLLTPQLGILYLLGEHGPLSQVEIGGNFSIDRASMVKLIDGLEAKRMVIRKADPGDRRANRIELTKPGRDVLAKAVHLEREVERELLSTLSAAEAKALKTLMPKLIS